MSHAGANGEKMYSYSFLTSVLDGVSGPRHATAALNPRVRTSGTHWIAGWVGLSAGQDTEARRKILWLCQRSNPCRAVCSQTLYWQNYLSSYMVVADSECCVACLLPLANRCAAVGRGVLSSACVFISNSQLEVWSSPCGLEYSCAVASYEMCSWLSDLKF
jgi:hypothetical protein